MATFSALYADSDYWDGTTAWGYDEAGVALNEGARNAKFDDPDDPGTQLEFSTIILWETDRDGKAASGVDEYLLIFGPWAGGPDTGNIYFASWTNTPDIYIRTVGPDARSQTGLYGANDCYVLDNDTDSTRTLDLNDTGFTVEFLGIQFLYEGNNSGYIVASDDAANITAKKCFFNNTGGAGVVRGINSTGNHDLVVENSIFWDCTEGVKANTGTGTADIYNCTVTGHTGDGIEDDGGVMTVKNCVVFNGSDDFDGPDVIDYCASDDGDDTGANGIDFTADAADWAKCFKDYANGDFTITEPATPGTDYLKYTGLFGGGAPTDDIIGNPRGDGTTSIGPYEFVAGGPSDTPSSTPSKVIYNFRQRRV